MAERELRQHERPQKDDEKSPLKSKEISQPKSSGKWQNENYVNS
jgi:hypothetical protein